jgi:hypothetical protein
MATYPGFNQILGSQQDPVDDRTVDQDVGGGVHVRGWFPARKSRFTIKHILTKDAFFALMTFYDLHRFDFFDFAWDLDDATYVCVFAAPPVCAPAEPQVLNVTVALREL